MRLKRKLPSGVRRPTRPSTRYLTRNVNKVAMRQGYPRLPGPKTIAKRMALRYHNRDKFSNGQQTHWKNPYMIRGKSGRMAVTGDQYYLGEMLRPIQAKFRLRMKKAAIKSAQSLAFAGLRRIGQTAKNYWRPL